MASAKHGRLFTEDDVRELLTKGMASATVVGLTGAEDHARMIETLLSDRQAREELTFPADEPLFLLRGQDATAPDAISVYIRHDNLIGTSDEFVDRVIAAEKAMRDWQAANPERVKVPD